MFSRKIVVDQLNAKHVKLLTLAEEEKERATADYRSRQARADEVATDLIAKFENCISLLKDKKYAEARNFSAGSSMYDLPRKTEPDLNGWVQLRAQASELMDVIKLISSSDLETVSFTELEKFKVLQYVRYSGK